MKRKDVEKNLGDLKQMAESKIVARPIPAFLVGLCIGALIISFKNLVVTMGLLAAVVLAGLWVFSEADDPYSPEHGNQD